MTIFASNEIFIIITIDWVYGLSTLIQMISKEKWNIGRRFEREIGLGEWTINQSKNMDIC